MNLEDDRDGRRRRKPESGGERTPPAPPAGRARRTADGELGDALRSAYDRVVDEDIPPEMLDLLGKLG